MFDGNNSCDAPNYQANDNILEIAITKAGEYRLIKTLELLTPPYELDYLLTNNLIEDATTALDAYLIEYPG